MSRAAWSCAECDTNNSAQNDVCRICSASRAAAGGVVREPVQRVRQTVEQPLFIESRYAAPPPRLVGTGPPPVFTVPRPVGPRPTPPPMPRPAPLMPRPAPPVPRPPVRRPAGYRRRSRGRVWLWVLLVIAGLFVLGKLAELLPDPSGPPEPRPSATACPTEVAQWLPDGGSAVLEAAYTTSKHVITLCWTAGGALYYDGLVQGMPANSETHLSVLATQTAAGYTAVNGAYRYEITGTEVIIFKNDVEQIRYALTRTGP